MVSAPSSTVKARVLVIDDDAASCRLIAALFGAEGYEVQDARDGRAGLHRATSDAPDLVLLDMHLPEMDGLAVLEALATKAPRLPVIMLTAERELKTAVRATRLGAYDYLTKPIDQDELLAVVRRALETRALRAEVDDLRRQLANGDDLAAQMGPSARVRDVVDQVTTVAATELTVLVLGETGTGKELVSHAIHRRSERRHGPFVALDCGAIPETLLESELFGHERGAFTGAERKRAGRFELADGGTLFLDEVGNLPLALQAKLLRALESRQVVSVGGAQAKTTNVRFLAATNDDLEAHVKAGRFRSDLYFRLAQFTLRLPPLRERLTDIDYLATRFVQEASVEMRRPVREIAPAAMRVLERHPWPGNVRELRNVVRQAVLRTKGLALEPQVLQAILGTSKETAIVPDARSASGSLKEIAAAAASAAERQAICETLRATGGNKAEAARSLRTDYKTLHLKMKALGIRARDFLP